MVTFSQLWRNNSARSLAMALFALIVVMACVSTATTPTMVNLDLVSSRAQLTLVPVAKLESLSATGGGSATHRIELRTTAGRGFSLDIETESEDYLGAEYEEIVHDVSKQTNPHEPHLTVISRKETVEPIHRCLYHGRVSGDAKSTVSINTCNGHITGMIHLSNGELFSIEPVDRASTTQKSSSKAPIRSLSLSALRELALQGDLTSLADNNSEVLLVDVNAETKLVDQQERKGRLNEDGIDALSTAEDGAPTSACAADADKTRPPSHILRKLGYSQDEIDSMRLPTLAQDGDDEEDESRDSSIEPLADEKPTRYVEVVLYHDFARLRRFKTSKDMTKSEVIAAARADGIEIFNNIRAYYLNAGFRYNVVMVLKGHVFFAGGDPYLKYLARDGRTMVISNYGLLENFNKYRANYGHSNHDIGMLLSGNGFQANIMGVANVGSLCGGARWNGNINSITYRNIVKSSVLSAHENGHVLNSQHDARPGYIMNPYVSQDTSFSPQSIRSINGHLSRTSCTLNKPATATAIDTASSHGLGTLAITNDTDDDSLPSVAKTSFIYTDNLHATDRFDYVDSALVTDGWFAKAAFSLPSDEVVISSNIPHNAGNVADATKTGLSTLSIVLIAVGSAGFASCVTAMVLTFIVRKLFAQAHTDSKLGSTQQPAANTPVPATPNVPHQSSTLRHPSAVEACTPQATARNFTSVIDNSPNTPKIASPSYSESVKRRTSLPRLAPHFDHEDEQK